MTPIPDTEAVREEAPPRLWEELARVAFVGGDIVIMFPLPLMTLAETTLGGSLGFVLFTLLLCRRMFD